MTNAVEELWRESQKVLASQARILGGKTTYCTVSILKNNHDIATASQWSTHQDKHPSAQA